MSKDYAYDDPFAREMRNKMTSLKRHYSKRLYGDGTGVVGQLAASSATVEGGRLRFQLDTSDSARGFVGWFEPNELLALRADDGTTSALDTDLATEPANWRVISRRRSDDTVLLQGVDAAGADVTISSITTQPDAADVFYKYEQPTGASSALD